MSSGPAAAAIGAPAGQQFPYKGMSSPVTASIEPHLHGLPAQDISHMGNLRCASLSGWRSASDRPGFDTGRRTGLGGDPASAVWRSIGGGL